ncbi:hypothetical protein Bca101_040075 [Brassica carinata]
MLSFTQRQILMKCMLKSLFFLSLRTLRGKCVRELLMVEIRKIMKCLRGLILLTCFAKPSLLLIQALMEASLFLAVLLRIASLLWTIASHGHLRSFLPGIFMALSGVFATFIECVLGQPRRHLLTTGWSGFVNKKKLVSGDAVLFLRGDDGKLRLGVRRAAQFEGASAFSTQYNQNTNHNNFSVVAHAISSNSAFNIYYNPKGSWSNFIVPAKKFLKIVDYPFCIGMRFKARVESEDASERRSLGIITGISDLDPIRWPGSKWRCLIVRWDDNEANRHQQRVSPWEIEPSGSISSSSSFTTTGPKRSRIGFPNIPVSEGIHATDFEESLRFQRVLQGQEKFPGFINTSSDGGAGARRGRFKGTEFGDSYGIHKVLQGQETVPVYSMTAHQQQGLSQRNIWCGPFQNFGSRVLQPSSSPSSVLITNSNSPNGRLEDHHGGSGSRCRLFGFPLRDEPTAMVVPCVEGQKSASDVQRNHRHSQGRDMYGMRDMLLDIAL